MIIPQNFSKSYDVLCSKNFIFAYYGQSVTAVCCTNDGTGETTVVVQVAIARLRQGKNKMSIEKKPKVKESSMVSEKDEKDEVDFDPKRFKEFIEGSPDERKHRWKLKGKKVVITHTIQPEDLQNIDDLAESLGFTRAALLNFWIRQNLKKYGYGKPRHKKEER